MSLRPCPSALYSALIAVAAAVLPGAAALAQDEPLKVGFVYVGPVGDGGWTTQHDQGRQAVEAHFGDAVETTFVESVQVGADAERVMTQMALSGHDIIFTTSFGYMEATNNVAGRFPDVRFEHATGYTRAHPNVATYDARFYEGRAVIGTIAGRMTETNRIGYIASYPIPTVMQGINSAFLHARKVNPDAELVVVWLYTWFDPAREADAATALIEQGVDVIMQHTDSTAPLAAAAEAGAIGFGQATDMSQFADSSRISAIVDNWGPYYIERVQAVMDGTWEQAASWSGIADGVVTIGEITDAVPDDVAAEALALRDAIAAGEYHPFTGPINRQDGTPWLADGEVASDADLLGMGFYVEGMTGEVPN